MYSVLLIFGYANYNILAFCFVILGIIWNLKFKDKFINIIFQGIAFFLVTFTKQNIGAMYILATIVYNIYFGIHEKKLKKNFYQIVGETFVFLILTTIKLTYMYLQGNLYQFINFTVLGMGDFANHNFFQLLIETVTEILTIIFIFFMMIVILKIINIDSKKKENMILLFIYAIPMIIYMYPISNSYHQLLANELIVIMVTYFLDTTLEENRKSKIVRLYNGRNYLHNDNFCYSYINYTSKKSIPNM